jgi:hypothetical protein
MNLQSILLFKQESIAGELEALDGSNVIETVGGIKTSPYEGNKHTRNVDSPEPTAGVQVNTNPHQKFDFTVDAAGSGTVGVAPVFGPLLQACGLKLDDSLTTEVSYRLSQEKSPSVSLAKYEGDEVIYQGAGGRGTVVLSFDDTIPQFQFSGFLVSYERPAAATFPDSLIYDNYADPIPFTKDNMKKAIVNGRSVVMTGGSITFGSAPSYRNLPNQKEAIHPDLFVVSSITFVAKSIADENWFESLESHNGLSYIDVELEHGTAAGNIINYTSTKEQIINITEGELDNEKTYTLSLQSQVQPKLTFL